MANLKDIKKGDKVILRMFTGAFIEAKVVEMADAKKIGFTNKSGVKMVFDKATGKQIAPEPKNPKYANFIEEYDEEAEAEGLAKKNAPRKPKAETKKAAKKPVEPEVEEELEDEETDSDEEEEFEEDEESDDEDDEDEEVSYEDMSLAELRAECKERGIKINSKMKEDKLIELLEEYDDQEDEDEEDADDEDFEDEDEEDE